MRVQRKVVPVLTDEEIARALRACDPKTDWGARDFAILALMPGPFQSAIESTAESRLTS